MQWIGPDISSWGGGRGRHLNILDETHREYSNSLYCPIWPGGSIPNLASGSGMGLTPVSGMYWRIRFPGPWKSGLEGANGTAGFVGVAGDGLGECLHWELKGCQGPWAVERPPVVRRETGSGCGQAALCPVSPPPASSRCSVNKAAGEAWPCMCPAEALTPLGAMPTRMCCLPSQVYWVSSAPLWREAVFSMPPDMCARPTSSSCKTSSMKSREFCL